MPNSFILIALVTSLHHFHPLVAYCGIIAIWCSSPARSTYNDVVTLGQSAAPAGCQMLLDQLEIVLYQQ